jgi:hypothetical protein
MEIVNNIWSHITIKSQEEGSREREESMRLQYNNNHNQALYKQAYFMLCESCFWCCIFYGDLKKTITRKCPYCWHDRLKLVRILLNEIHYRFDDSLKKSRVITLGAKEINYFYGPKSTELI